VYLGGLCFITDKRFGGWSYGEMVRLALEAGVRWIQYRDKEGSGRDKYRTALEIRRLTLDYGAVFIVNDHTDIALAVDADGVHLGQDDLPAEQARRLLGGEKLIGLSTHTVEQAVNGEACGVDYIGFGPIFTTQTKDAGRPHGAEILHHLRRQVRIPIVAIGGITTGNLAPVLESGVDAVAAASGILSGDIGQNVRAFLEIIGRHATARG